MSWSWCPVIPTHVESLVSTKPERNRLDTMWLDSWVEELYHGLFCFLVEGKQTSYNLFEFKDGTFEYVCRNIGWRDHITADLFPLSTLLVQVARHRVSFSGNADSKSMRLDWWSDWWVIYCRYNIELGGYWIWIFDAVIYSGFEFVTGPCPVDVKYVLVE